MKEWSKEAIRAQPADLIAWSAAYFAALAAKGAGGGAGRA